MRKITALLLALVMIVGLAACGESGGETTPPATEPGDALQQQEDATQDLDEISGNQGDEEKQYGGTFIVGIPADPAGFMGAVSTDTYDKYAWQPMAIGLLDYDAANNMEPVCSELAESYEFSDDYMHLTFHLREAYWSDGEPITSEDVKFTIEEFLLPYSSNMQNELVNLESIECPDESTVTINLSQPNKALIGFWHSFYCSVLPEHVWADYAENYQDCPEFLNPTVVGGPFILSEYVSGDHITYVRNENYWSEEEPYVDTVILRIIPDQTTMGEALEAGEIDLAPSAAISYDECDRLRDVDGITVYDIGKELRTTVYYVGLNQQSEKLADKEVRAALLEAVDQDDLITTVFNGYGQACYTPIPNNSAFNEIRIEPDEVYDYDPESAAARLDAAGYPADANGNRDLTITIVCESNEKERMLSESLRSYWAAVGVETEIVSLDRAAMVERVYTQRDYDVTFIDGGLSSDFATCANRYCSSYTGNYCNPGNLNNPELDELFKIVGAQDEETQKATYAELQNLIASEASFMWLQNWAPYAVSDNVGGHPFRPDVQFDNWAGVWIKN